MLTVTDTIEIAESELEERFIRSPGAGGQNVNKVSSAIHLRFDVAASSLPDAAKRRLSLTPDRRITTDGVIIIKAQNHRTQDKNRAEALSRLADLVKNALRAPRKRIPTRPGRAVKERRLDAKKRRSSLKKLRDKPYD
jgi:ribosome-associated protein